MVMLISMVIIVQQTLFITIFVITAKFVITSIQSAQKSADDVCFIKSPLLFFRKTYVLDICKNEAILTNTQNI